MGKFWVILPLAVLLSGCAAEETLETVSDEWLQPVMAEPRSISVQLPQDAQVPVMDSGTEQVYLCEDYEIVLETLSSGDLQDTVRQISGCDKSDLTILQTSLDGVERYEFVWAAAGERGDRLGRAVILDDGQYHYCLSAMRDAQGERASQILWNDVFRSFRLT